MASETGRASVMFWNQSEASIFRNKGQAADASNLTGAETVISLSKTVIMSVSTLVLFHC